ncbi:AraC family transcriptional regulator [Raoultella ornithinolytica]|uniref:AraC family transcriptional regulator n=1 Tax=Raoultella ornithinolytica TaxID=54291 RepID=UPI0022A8D2DB|nr:AraC family transcriptional regulator [Raoultella ornithinolytica]MCZ0882706.1 AraC family transcriptional regulator [Raoultella ornithinolytica]MDV1102121.1 AraC family transcriptional regulator [Raoultella ornithinolytica]HDH7838905.1 helix-turn-helix domain-containing protein [Raoultella ornithinolytica]HDT6555351.1 helix-turn-helix domain-containing protein [Raoultella ornithinolytica]
MSYSDPFMVNEWIFKITDRESRYLKSKALPARYLELKQKVILGEKVYVFNHTESPVNITVNIHPRFIAVPAHIHDYIELSYVYSGTFTQIVNGKKITLSKGDIIIVDTSVVHSSSEATQEDIIINLLIHTSFISSEVLKKSIRNSMIMKFILNAASGDRDRGGYVVFNTQANTRIPYLFQSLVDINCSPKELMEPAETDIVNSHFAAILLLELCREWSSRTFTSHIPESTDEKVFTALNLIEENYTNISAETLSKRLGVSINYMGRLLKLNTGKSFKQLVHEKRLTRASVLLKSTEMPVYKISVEIGYENVSFFYAKFKEKYKMLPNEYRNS